MISENQLGQYLIYHSVKETVEHFNNLYGYSKRSITKQVRQLRKNPQFIQIKKEIYNEQTKRYIEVLMRTGASGRQILTGLRKANRKVSDKFVYDYLRKYDYNPQIALMNNRGEFRYQGRANPRSRIDIDNPYQYIVSAVFIMSNGEISFANARSDYSQKWLKGRMISPVPLTYDELRKQAREGLFFAGMTPPGSSWEYAVFVVHVAYVYVT